MKDVGVGKNDFIFGADISSSRYIDTWKKRYLNACLTQTLDDATLLPETKYSFNITRSKRKIV